MPDWLKKIALWLDRVERALNADPNDYIVHRLGALEEKVAAMETRIDDASKTAAP